MPSEQEVLEHLIHRFQDLTAKLDVGPITVDTTIKALGLRSMSVVIALVEIQEHFGLRDELLNGLLADGIPLDDHRIGGLRDYVVAALRSRER